MRAKLTVLRGSSKGKTIVVTKPQYVVGRNEKCQLRLNHEAISRQHCAFLLSENKVALRDLGSRNGTLVNGEKIRKQVELQTGDEVQFGPLSFSVELVGKDGKTIPPADAAAAKSEPAASASSSDSGIISDWLSDAESGNAPVSGSSNTTRLFKIDPAALPEKHEEKSASETQEISDGDTKQIGSKKKKKSKPGKLPADVKQPKGLGDNTQQAAAETLRRLFTRGS